MSVSRVDVWRRSKEIDMFFAGESPVHRTMHRLVERLDQAGIAYAIMGGMAVNLHGAERTTRDLDVLLTAEGLQQFRQQLVPTLYGPTEGRSRRFIDQETHVTIDFLVTGHKPGFGPSPPFEFPDPTAASEAIHGTRVVTLVHLIQLKLAAGRYYDFGDVVFLIRVHGLEESFADRLHPAVRSEYIECLEEKRREDQYKDREEIG